MVSEIQVVESGSKCVNGVGIAIDTGLGGTGVATSDAVDAGEGVGTFTGGAEDGFVQAIISRTADAVTSVVADRRAELINALIG